MKIEQLKFSPGQRLALPGGLKPDLVLAFGDSETLESSDFTENILSAYPSAQVVFVSAPNHIIGSEVHDGGGSVTLVAFDETRISAFATTVPNPAASEDAGREVGAALSHRDLTHVLLFSEGLNINGTALIRGLTSSLPAGVTVTGGLASDGENFGKTLVGLNAKPEENRVVGIGFSGDSLRVAVGSLGGWLPFGREMLVTRSDGNVVYELDGKPALALYRELLGSRAYGLPASGLLYPLSISPPEGGDSLVRTLLGISEDTQSVTFAGDVPQGFIAKVMQANLDQLIEAAGSAASVSARLLPNPDLAILVSCIGRKLLLQLRANEEVAAARRIIGSRAIFAGFYSYGEISPLNEAVECRLQNQTMTITTFTEEP